jgi:hypothetical protein
VQGKVSYHSIDPGVQSLFVVESHGDLSVMHSDGLVLQSVYAKLAATLGGEMQKAGETNYGVVIMEPRMNPRMYSTEYTMIAIPNELERLRERVKELETALMLERRHNWSMPLRVDND